MNLKKGKFKIVEGTRVRMVSSKDTHIVEGAWEKAYDTVDLGDLEVRDCEYSNDEITLLEE